MALFIEKARSQDIDALLKLYDLVYRGRYTLPLGTQREAALRVLRDPENLWLLARDAGSSEVAASAVFEKDALSGLFKLEGVAVAPKFRGLGLSEKIIHEGIRALESMGEASFFSTVRTRSYGAQAMVLSNGFLPSGLLPNAHRLDALEFHVVTMRLSPERRARRKPLGPLEPELIPLLNCVNRAWHEPEGTYTLEQRRLSRRLPREPEHWELSPSAQAGFEPGASTCVPWGKANFVARALDSSCEVALEVEPNCAAVLVSYSCLPRNPASLLWALREHCGAPSLQVVFPADQTAEIRRFLDSGFAAVAFLPTFLQEGAFYRDAVLLAFAPEPLDDSGVRLTPVMASFVRELGERDQVRASTIQGNFPPGFSAGGPM